MKPTGSSAADVTDTQALAQLKGAARSQSPEALKQTAQQFESMFLQMAMKNMRQAGESLGSNMADSNGARMFRDMHDQQMAMQLAKKSNLGFADMVVKQLGKPPASSAAQRSDSGFLKAGAPAAQGKKLGDYRHDTVRMLPLHKSAEGLPIKQAPDKALSMPVRPGGHVGHAKRHEPPFADEKDFFTTLLPEAEAAARELGVDPKLLLSQVALETGWGKHTPHRGDGSDSHNLFGIKAGSSWRGARVANTTLEYEQGIPVKKIDYFRAYGSYKESFQDYVGLLRNNPRYADALEKSHVPRQYMASLQKAGYATDPNYAGKVMSIYQQWRNFDADAPALAANPARAG